MDGSLQHLLAEVKAGLQALYGQRLQGVYLYGSYARGEQTDESDVDILIVLDRIDGYSAEIERTGYLIARLSSHYDVSVSRVIVSNAEWCEATSPFFENVREDAIHV